MTAEVIVMNKRAIALAADSAITVTSWMSGKRVERYVKGANKIFELSDAHPVGIMIFNASSMHSVPWELIIKSFRSSLGGNARPYLGDYARDLFEYIEKNSSFFPATRQDETQKSKVIDVFIDLLIEIDRVPSVIAAKGNQAAMNAARDAVLADLQAKLSNEALPGHFAPTACANALAKWGGDIAVAMAPSLTKRGWTSKQNELIALSFEALYKRYKRYLDHTGLVATGYGENEFFPSYRYYDCYGFLDGELIVDLAQEESVTFDDGAKIEPFAMSSMAETFMLGLSPDIYSVLGNGIRSAMDDLSKAVETHLGGALPATLGPKFASVQQEIIKELMNSCMSEHFNPLTRAIGSLPVDEMANLAETLIMLESLKERVTRPSESVGGAVDVAVITKSEGVVWIKRKHFFSAELNPKFFERQKQRFE